MISNLLVQIADSVQICTRSSDFVLPSFCVRNTWKSTLVTRGRPHFWQHQEWCALAGPDFLSLCRVFVSYFQSIRFVRFDRKSVNTGDQPRGRDSWCRPKKERRLWGRDVGRTSCLREFISGARRNRSVICFCSTTILQNPLIEKVRSACVIHCLLDSFLTHAAIA